MAGAAALTTAVAPVAQAAPHAVKYVITSDRDFLSQTQYIKTEPANKAAFDAAADQYLVRNPSRISPDEPLVVETSLSDPTQWAYLSASAATKAVTGTPVFHCEIWVDGAVAIQQDGEGAVTCALRQW